MIAMANADGMKIEALTSDDQVWVAEKRAFVFSHFADEDRGGLLDARGKLSAINAVLQSGIYNSTDTAELQALGVVFGDVLAEVADLAWVTHSDQHGSEPALVVEGTDITVFPLTIISKRIERDEHVDPIELLGRVISAVNEQRETLLNE